MSGLRIILCCVFALAFVVPSYLRGDDVICIENTGRISIGCREVVDTAMYAPSNKTTTTSAPHCGPCNDIQISWSEEKDASKLTAPIKIPLFTMILPFRHFGVLGRVAVSHHIDPLVGQSNTATSLRC